MAQSFADQEANMMSNLTSDRLFGLTQVQFLWAF